MDESRLWDLSVDELERLSQRVLEVADMKKRYRFADVLPPEIHDSIGEILAREEPRALGHLTSSSKQYESLYRRQLEKTKGKEREREREFVEAFEFLKPLGQDLCWKSRINNLFENPTNDEKNVLNYLKTQNVNTFEEFEKFIYMRAPKRCHLVYDISGKPRALLRTFDSSLNSFMADMRLLKEMVSDVGDCDVWIECS